MTVPFRRSAHLVDHIPVEWVEDIWFHARGGGRWQVLDRRLSANDIRALLGSAELDGSGVAVTLIGEPGRIRYADNLNEAAEIFLSEDSNEAGARFSDCT